MQRADLPRWFGELLTERQLTLPPRQLWLLAVFRTGNETAGGLHAPGENGLTPTQRYVAALVAAWIDEAGWAECTDRQLAAAGLIADRTVRAAVSGQQRKPGYAPGLVDLGWLQVKGRRGRRPTGYRARLPRADPRPCPQLWTEEVWT